MSKASDKFAGGERIAARLNRELAARLRVVTESSDPYRPSVTQIVERGIELALDEIEAKGQRRTKVG